VSTFEYSVDDEKESEEDSFLDDFEDEEQEWDEE